MLLQQSITELVHFKEKKNLFFSVLEVTSVVGLLHHSMLADSWENKHDNGINSYTIMA